MKKQKTSVNLIINDFLKALDQSFKTVDPAKFWPLNGNQLAAYFDHIQAVEIYDKIYTLKKQGLPNNQISKLFRQPSILHYFLINNAIIGLKMANIYKTGNFPSKKRIHYTLLLIDLLKVMVQGDIFCLQDTNLIYSQNQINKVSKTTNFRKATNKKLINDLIVSLYQLCNSFYYDVYIGAGLEIHGPYNCQQNFGKNTFCIIRDYFDLKPVSIWPKTAKLVPFSKVRIILIYKNTDWKINFFNQPDSKKGLGPYLEYYSIQADGKEIQNLSKIAKTDQLIEKIVSQQTNLVNKSKPLDQAKKGVEIAYYMLRDFYTIFGQKPKPSKKIANIFTRNKDKYIKEFQITKNHPVSYYKKLFDPRNNFIG